METPIARGYVRVSTTMQAEDGLSIDNQNSRIADYCRFKGLNLVKVYEDKGLSGKDTNRPALQELLSDIKKGETFIITDLSRFSRNTRDALCMLEDLKNRGVIFVCLALSMDTSTPIGIMTVTILLAFHTLERQNTAINVSSNMRHASKEGKLRPRPPMGYRYVGKDRDMEPVPEQLQVVETIKQMYSDGKKYSQIAKQLNDNGDNSCLSLNKKNQSRVYRFHPETIKRILMDEEIIDKTDNRKSISQRIYSHHKSQ